MLTQEELDTLAEKLPNDWVKRVRETIDLSEAKIRQALRSPKPQDTYILDAITDVATAFKAEVDQKLISVKSKITNLQQ